MPQKKYTKKTKPEAIAKLESKYNIRFAKVKSITDVDEASSDDCYSLDSEQNIEGLSISFIIDTINELESENLRYLNLSSVGLEDISPLWNHTRMECLYIGGNKIKKIDGIQNMSYLKILAIWKNPIEDFGPLNTLNCLEDLYGQSMGLKDLSFILNLPKLKNVVLSGNQISDLNPLRKAHDIGQIDVSRNHIQYIPNDIAEKYGWLRGNQTSGRIIIHHNPLQYPPMSVIDLGHQAIKTYYKTCEEFGHAPLSEGRIIVVGDGSAGKSSLIERILYDTFNQGKTQTNGITIEHLFIEHKDSRKLTFHVWDFGGQEIQHAVHKFFFTEGCLYILVLDNRKEEDPEYWLQQIESLGGSAPVIVVFNKQDDNVSEIADRKFLKEKYSNIVSFFNTSCKTGSGIKDFKSELQNQAIKLRTVDEQFPANWFNIKRAIEECTSGAEHYIDFQKFNKICNLNNVDSENIQKLLLKYFTMIGSVTWFGDTFLNFLHVLSPAWITQGVYKIITSKKTDELSGKIRITDFKELLQAKETNDFIYEETHYGYILTMMKKFDLCYTPDDIIVLIPSAFGKVPKVEYSEFRGDEIRTYILQFKDYLPIGIIHKFIAKKLPEAYDNNYWYTGIVVKDRLSDVLTMVHIDREAKRIYIRIKGDTPLGMWEYVRREFSSITSSYAKIPYDELVLLDEISESTVNYDDLISYLQSQKKTYFHPKLKRDFNVGYLLGFFQTKEQTIKKIREGEIGLIKDAHSNNKIYRQSS
jgi:internalin A